MEEKEIIKEITGLRWKLHRYPEAAFSETNTKTILKQFLHVRTDLEIMDGGRFLCAIKRGSTRQPGICFRAEMDAVCVSGEGARHLCGHDGHMAALAGLGLLLTGKRPERDVFLLFQPAEETGEGAEICKVILRQENIGEVYGFHNIPGYEAGEILLRDGTFACASTGLEITMTGAVAHAAYPESGQNPAKALAALVLYMYEQLKQPHEGIVLGTVIGLQLGSSAYGVSAGNGTLHLTLRAEKQSEYTAFVSAIEAEARRLAAADGLGCTVRFLETFPATENQSECVQKLRVAAGKAGLPIRELEEPMRWSEDFGVYLQRITGAFFGVGAGKNHVQLHTTGYQFPDEILPNVLKVYRNMLGL